MELRSLSASSVETYEDCAAGWKATYNAEERAQDLASGHAEIGTACHEALENFVVVLNCGEMPSWLDLEAFFDEAYWKLFSDRAKYDDGIKMLTTWYRRQDWSGRKVLHTETKKFFMLPYAGGEVKVNYIFDRVDQLDGKRGLEIEVVDYKTVSMPVQPGELHNRIQPRLYALAAAIEYKRLNPERIWVTYDLLRYEPVSAAFTRFDNRVTWRYLKAVADRIFADEDAVETLNPKCRWCIRAPVCDTLRIHREAGGILSLTEADEIADMRAELFNQKAGITALVDKLDDALLAHMQHEDVLELQTEKTNVKITARKTRSADAERVASVLGAEFIAANGSISIRAVDEMLKGDELTQEQKIQLKGLIRKSYGAPSIKTTPIAPHEED